MMLPGGCERVSRVAQKLYLETVRITACKNGSIPYDQIESVGRCVFRIQVAFLTSLGHQVGSTITVLLAIM